MFAFEAQDGEVSDEELLFLQYAASSTITRGLKNCYKPGIDAVKLWVDICSYFPENFFEGFGHCVNEENDTLAGAEFIQMKVNRMIEKMESDQPFSFDFFEEYLFDVAIREEKDTIGISKWLGEEENVYSSHPLIPVLEDRLVSSFGYTVQEAEEMADALCRFDKMGLGDNERTNFFFSGREAKYFFKAGFVKGIHQVIGFMGESLGYGYAYGERIFTDIGMKPPLRLLGTEEGTKVRNQAEEEFLERIFLSGKKKD